MGHMEGGAWRWSIAHFIVGESTCSYAFSCCSMSRIDKIMPVVADLDNSENTCPKSTSLSKQYPT